jgi:hypothetical protein
MTRQENGNTLYQGTVVKAYVDGRGRITSQDAYQFYVVVNDGTGNIETAYAGQKTRYK